MSRDFYAGLIAVMAAVFFISPAFVLELGNINDTAALTRSGVGMDFFEVVGNDVRIDLGSAHVGVTQHFLNVSDRGPAL